MMTRTTEIINEINWSDINSVLNEIADYYLKKFDKKSNVSEYLLRQFDEAVNNELCGIRLEDYLRTNNCSLELVGKYNNLLNIKTNFFNKDYVEVEEKHTNTNTKAPIETYIKEMEATLKERNKEVLHATIDPNSTLEEVENDYEAIAELLGDEDIVIKFKENE